MRGLGREDLSFPDPPRSRPRLDSLAFFTRPLFSFATTKRAPIESMGQASQLATLPTGVVRPIRVAGYFVNICFNISIVPSFLPSFNFKRESFKVLLRRKNVFLVPCQFQCYIWQKCTIQGGGGVLGCP